ncbi:hypothetical protein D3C80_1758140 [compost metagenome]
MKQVLLQRANLPCVEAVETADDVSALQEGCSHENAHIVAFGIYIIALGNYVNPLMCGCMGSDGAIAASRNRQVWTRSRRCA